GIDFHWFITDVGDVVPAAGRNEDDPVIFDFLLEIQIVLRRSHLDSSASLFQAQKLVIVGMNLEANVIPNRDRHDRKLNILTSPSRGPVVLIGQRGFFYVRYIGIRSVIG